MGCVITCHGFASEVSGLHGTRQRSMLGIFVSSKQYSIVYKIDRTRSTGGIAPKCLIRQYDESGKTIVYTIFKSVSLKNEYNHSQGFICYSENRVNVCRPSAMTNQARRLCTQFSSQNSLKLNTFFLRASFPILRIGCIGTMMWLNDMDAAVFG